MMYRVAKALAFVFALCISAVGIVGIVWPAALLWIAQRFVASGSAAFYALAAVRMAFGFVLILAASASRTPKALRILGGLIVILGITTAFAGSVAIEQSQSAINWWEQQGHAVLRLTSAAILTLGSFVAYACAPN
jgi:hypothetical protein